MPLRALVALPRRPSSCSSSPRGKDLTHDPVNVVIFVVASAAPGCSTSRVSAIIGTLGLYLESSLQVWELWLGGFMLLSGYLIPLSLFPPWLEQTARVLPFAYLQAFPVETLTGTARSRTRRSSGSACSSAGRRWRGSRSPSCGRAAVKRFAAYGG